MASYTEDGSALPPITFGHFLAYISPPPKSDVIYGQSLSVSWRLLINSFQMCPQKAKQLKRASHSTLVSQPEYRKSRDHVGRYWDSGMWNIRYSILNWDPGMWKIDTDIETETQECEKSIPILRLRLRDVQIRYQYWDWDQQVSRYWDDIDSIVCVWSQVTTFS